MASILLRILRICNSLFKCNYLKNQKIFLNFFFHFWNPRQILNILKQKMIVKATVFPRLQTVQHLVRQLSTKRGFRTSFDCQHVEGSQTPLKSAWGPFYHTLSSLWQKMIWKISLLLKLEILGEFVNTLLMTSILFGILRISSPLFKCNYLKNEKHFSQLFVPFMESLSNFKLFEIQDDRHTQCISDITDCQRLG